MSVVTLLIVLSAAAILSAVALVVVGRHMFREKGETERYTERP